MRSPEKKDILRLIQDGPTLAKLAEKITQEYEEDVSQKSIGDILVELQNKGYAFLEEGRWWRTPEGVAYVDRLIAEEAQVRRKRTKQDKSARRERLAPSPVQTSTLQADHVVALVIALAVATLKTYFAYGYLLPIWDGMIYLLNARRFLYGYDPFSLFELLRPPLLPVMISSLWAFFGENYLIAIPIQPIFTVLAALLLYAIVRRMFDRKTAMLSFLLFLFNPNAFMQTNLLLTHGVGLVFALLSIFFAWRTYSDQTGEASIENYTYPALVGFFGALTSLTRYPAVAFFPAVLFLGLRGGMKKGLRWLTICGCSFVATWLPWFGWNYRYAGGDPFASVKAGFAVGAYVGQPEPWYYYLTSLMPLITIVGVVLLVIGIAGKSTFRDPKILTFLSWFALAMIAHSIFVNKQLRFTIEWFPAIAVLMALGVRRIQGRLKNKMKGVFNLALVAWLVYLVASSTMLTIADISEKKGSTEREFPTVVSWVTTNIAKTDICSSDDLFTPHFAYFTKRLFYNLEYLDGESKTRGITMVQMLSIVNVSYVIVSSRYAVSRQFDSANYLILVKKFQAFSAYAVLGAATSKRLGILIVGNYAKSPTTPQFSQPSLTMQETIRGSFPRFDTVNSDSFYADLESALAEDRRPRHGLIVLLDELWSESTQSLVMSRAQIAVLRKLVEEHGVALLTSGDSTRGWLLETKGITVTGISTFTSFRIVESMRIPGWFNLLGNDRVWNISVPSRFRVFPSTSQNLESIVETSGLLAGRGLVGVGNHGKGRIACFSCTALDLSFSPEYPTVNPILTRILFWLLGDYPRIAKGSTFKVALRIDDTQAALFNSIQKHASVLTDERHIPMSLSVIPKDLTEVTAVLLLRLRSQGCELTLHGFPGHYDLLTYANQTQALIDGREAFHKWLGFYPTMLVPPLLSFNDETVKAAQTLGFKAICGASFGNKPPTGTGNHFGYPFNNSTVVNLPVLSLLDFGPYGDWILSAQHAIAKTKWELASQKWIRGSSIIEFHFNDTRLPEIARLTDWIKEIGGEFGTLEQLMNDSFLSPSLEPYSRYQDAPSFLSLDMIVFSGLGTKESAQDKVYQISFVLKEPIKLRIDTGGVISSCRIDGKAQEYTGEVVVTELLETGKEHIVVIQMKIPSK